MSKRAFSQGDWVKIKYGEYTDRYGKVCLLEKSGSYMVIPYDKDNEPQAMQSFLSDNLKLIEPYILSNEELKDFTRGKLLYSDFSDKVFPPFNLKALKQRKLTAKDICLALKKINATDTPLSTFKEWFWLIINVFYDDLKIAGRYNEDGLTDHPVTDDELFSDIFGLTEKLYWRLEERFSKKEDNEKYIVKFKNEPKWDIGALNDDDLEKQAYFTVCDDIFSRVSIYEKNKKLQPDEPEYSLSQKKIFVSELDEMELSKMPAHVLEKYKRFVLELSKENDAHAMRILAWSYYEGSPVFPQNWKLAEKWLLKLYKNYGDPFAANSLGYIYYYGRTSNGKPDYEKAFKYFSFGALAGIDESIYKSGDMLIHGQGTTKSIDTGINMIVDGYRASLEEFCFGDYTGKFADYALRMGNICRDKLIYGMGMRDAYKFFLEARFAIKKRRAAGKFYGDKTVEATIEREIEKIQDRVGLDLSRKILRADFPLYINQLFEDPFPVKVSITQKGKKGYYISFKRFRLDTEFTKDMPIPDRLKEIPKILVCYPELSYTELVSELYFELENVTVVKKPEKGDYFLADGFRKNEHTNAVEFFSGGEFVAAVACEWYVIDISKKNDL